jgi:oligopeptide/dipeptide ABC transporter ATP-binding protein
MDFESLDRYPHSFSGGQLQRLAIARALLLEPELLVLDEPLASLDLSQQAQILRLLSQIKERLGLTFIFITHDLQVVESFADEVVVLYLGKVMEQGSAKEIFSHPRHPYTKALLSSIPPSNPWEKRNPMPIGSILPSPFDPPSGCPFRTRCPFAMPKCSNLIPPKSEGRHIWWCVLEDERTNEV